MLKPKIGLAVIYHPYEEGAEEAPRLLSKAKRILDHLGLEVVLNADPVHDSETATGAGNRFREARVDLLCLPLATWSSDFVVLDLLEQRDAPVITWAFPGVHTGSLCGCQQIDCVLKELDKEYRFVYGETPRAKKEILDYSRAIALRNKLRMAKLGLIGYRTHGMTEVTFDEYALRSVFGPSIVHIGIDKLKDEVAKISPAQARKKMEQIRGRVGKVTASAGDCLHSVKTYLALRGFIGENGLSGLATECYPGLMGQVCLPHSLLGEEGIVAACEGDINSAVAMLMLHELTGRPVHNTDLLAVYERDNSALFSHCGSGGFSLAERADDIVLGPVRLAHKGVCVLFPPKLGNVTMVNIVGREGTYRMCVISGKSIPTKMVFPGNPLRVRMPMSTDEFLGVVAKFGFGHHWMIGDGDVSSELVQLGHLEGIKVVSIPEVDF
jgi:L-fucose isomerase-like protein